MGLIAPGDTGTVVPVNGPLPAGVLGEVRLHQCIYRERPDVGAVVRSMPASLMALSAARRVPRPLHGPGSYFGAQGAALWDDPQLIRDDTRAQAVTDTLGERAAVVMRGNGVVVVGASLLEAVVRTWYLEDAARLELSLLAAGLGDQAAVMSAEECAQRATTQGGILERMGQFLCAGDPEGSLG
jgi:HCOMODA/2-hydroxy-3-carboxy-muconic semialdehyde decarboxylase